MSNLHLHTELPPAQAVQHDRRAWRGVGLVALLVVSACMGVWFWRQSVQVPPQSIPQVSLDRAGPAARKAIQEAEDLVGRKPKSGVAWGRLGMVLLAHNFEEPAGICFMAAHELDSTSSRWPYYAGVTLAISDPQQALVHFATSAKLAPEEPWPKFRQAELLMDFQRLDEAEQVLNSISLLEPSDRLIYDQVRLVLLRQNPELLKQLPVEQLRQLQAGSNRRACLELLAQVWHRLGRKSESDAVARQLRAESPRTEGWDDPYVAEVFAMRKDPLWQADLARKAFAAGQTEEALRRLTDLVADHPDDPQWAIELARMWGRLGKSSNAKSVLLAAAKQHPNSAELYFELGNLQHQSSDWPSAVKSYSAATRLKPDYGLAYYNLGQTHLQWQHPDEALAAFQQALRCQPDLAVAHLNLGELLIQRGKPTDLAAARQHLERSLKLAPKDRRAAELLERLPKP